MVAIAVRINVRRIMVSPRLLAYGHWRTSSAQRILIRIRAERDGLSNRRPQPSVAGRIEDELHESDVGLRIIIAIRSGADGLRKLEIEARFLLVVFVVFAVARRAIQGAPD